MGQKILPNIFRLVVARKWLSTSNDANFDHTKLHLEFDILLRDFIKVKACKPQFIRRAKDIVTRRNIGKIKLPSNLSITDSNEIEDKFDSKLFKNVFNNLKLSILVSINTIWSKHDKLKIDLKMIKSSVFTHGASSNKNTAELTRLFAMLSGLSKNDVIINILTIRNPETDTNAVAILLAKKIESRAPYKRMIKQAISDAKKNPVVAGIKIKISGRLNGNEIARTQFIQEGPLPLSSLRSNIDYGMSNAYTQYGVIGLQVWIHKNTDLWLNKK